MSDALWQHVETYASFPSHRTGTAGDASVRTWLSALLQRRGASVEVEPFPVLLHEGSATVDAGPAELLSYTLDGEIDAEAAVVSLEAGALIGIPALAEARAATDLLVVATRYEGDRLYVPNVAPQRSPGAPVVLVPGHLVSRGKVRVTATGMTRDGEGANVIARWGEEPRLLITTPMNGWFSCVGERATGLAIALEIAEVMRAEMPVELVIAGGHELLNAGAKHHLARRTYWPSAVLHVGASAAACGEDPTRLDPSVQIATRENPQWRGEAVEWHEHVERLVSITGASPWFHTPQDVLPQATNPGLLRTSFERLLGFAREMACR